MKNRLAERLRCPACIGALALERFHDEAAGPEHGESITRDGVLLCDRCKVWYPVLSFVPVMLVFETNLHAKFARTYGEELLRFPEYGPPRGEALPGEISVQETFTEEWEGVQGDRLSFAYTAEDLRKLHGEVWLRWLPEARSEIRTVLNVGIGLGQETLALHDVLPGTEIFAVDLNFALLACGDAFKTHPSVSIIIASLFRLPFARASFDLVYSQGVIHHTYSTRNAFDSLTQLVRSEGYLFIWVYGRDDHLYIRGPLGINRYRRVAEEFVRPVVSKLPSGPRNVFFKVASVVAQPLVKPRMWNRSAWKIRNTEHTLRDWLSPRFAHRHSYNEVIQWYEDAGFRVIDLQSTSRYRELFGRKLSGVGMSGRNEATAQR
jgi:SAM-dependent methyltransferase